VSSADLEIVSAFNDAINARDLAALSDLMAHDHRFVDAAGAVVEGKAACLEAWSGFFAAFPDYRNVFDEVRAGPGAAVVANGRSESSVPDLAGPARWRVELADGRVVEWRVLVD
jgi:ketosteroid isomerase-like protein